MREGFVDRDMPLVMLLDTGISTAGDRALGAKEVDAIRTELGLHSGEFALRVIGKDGSVKYSTTAPAMMENVGALIETKPMRQLERAARRGVSRD